MRRTIIKNANIINEGKIFESDILIEDSLEKCIDEAHKRFGRIDCAIHAAYPKSKGLGT